MKHLILLLPLLFLGCKQEESPHYDAFITQYGASSRYFCNEAGFLIHEYAYEESDVITQDIVRNDAAVPTRCDVKDISIRVKETVATGSLSGSVQ